MRRSRPCRPRNHPLSTAPSLVDIDRPDHRPAPPSRRNVSLEAEGIPLPKKHRKGAVRAHIAVRVKVGVVQMYPVYAREDVLGQTPLTFVSKAIRDTWIEQGAAESVSRGKAIRLKLNTPPRTPLSLSMGPSVIEGFASGKALARSFVAMYGGSDRRDVVAA